MIRSLFLSLILTLLQASVIFSQGVNTSGKEKRLALVIGNGNYLSSVLSNPENDAKAMAGVLKKMGLTTTVETIGYN
ncbi:MAG: caspase family protein [Bacteroidales bacterium]